MLARRKDLAKDPYYARDPFVHPELAWPEDAPITAEEFVKMRAAEPEPRDDTTWSFAYVLEHYSPEVIRWAHQIHGVLYHKSASLKYPPKRQPGLFKHTEVPNAFVDLEPLAWRAQHNPKALEAYITQQRETAAYHKWHDRHTSPWRRARWAAVLTGLMDWWLYALLSAPSTPPPGVTIVHANRVQVEAAVLVIVFFNVVTWALYFWRSANWTWTDKDEWALLHWVRGLLFGVPAGVLVWLFLFRSVHMPVEYARQVAIGFGAWIAVWMRRRSPDIDFKDWGDGLLLGLLIAPFLLLFLL